MGPLDPSRLGAFLMRQIPPSDGEVVERGNVLPLGTYRTPDGQETTTLAFPQPMREGLDALAYALGYRQDPNAPAGYVTHDALNKGGQGLAESAMVGSLAASRPANALGMFAGRNAKTADLAALERAIGHAERGSGRDYIWKTTGWFQGPDGKWRFEIDDRKSAFNKDAMENKEYNFAGSRVNVLTGKTSDVMNHPELYKAYPELGDLTVSQGRGDMGGQYSGTFSDPLVPPSWSVNFEKKPTADMQRRVGLHELQHGIQDLEGFQRGANPEAMGGNWDNPALARYESALTKDPRLIEYTDIKSGKLFNEYQRQLDEHNKFFVEGGFQNRFDSAMKNDNIKEMDAVLDEYQALSDKKFPLLKRADELALALKDDGIPTYRPDEKLSPYDAYKSVSGEVEARAVEARRDLTPEQRRARPPWLDYDVPEANQIVRANPMAGAVPLAFPAPQEDRNQALARFLASGGA